MRLPHASCDARLQSAKHQEYSGESACTAHMTEDHQGTSCAAHVTPGFGVALTVSLQGT